MADEVRAEYDQLEQVAGKFTNQAQVIQDMLQQVRGKMEQLQDDGWIGLGADAFFAEMEGLVLPAVQRLESALTDASDSTKQTSQNLRQAEEEASSLFDS